MIAKNQPAGGNGEAIEDDDCESMGDEVGQKRWCWLTLSRYALRMSNGEPGSTAEARRGEAGRGGGTAGPEGAKGGKQTDRRKWGSPAGGRFPCNRDRAGGTQPAHFPRIGGARGQPAAAHCPPPCLPARLTDMEAQLTATATATATHSSMQAPTHPRQKRGPEPWHWAGLGPIAPSPRR